MNNNGAHDPSAVCERSVSTKASLHSSSRIPRPAAPGAVRKPVQTGKAGKIDAVFNGRGANLRHQLLYKIVTVAAEHVEHIEDAAVPRVLKALKAGHTLEEALRL